MGLQRLSVEFFWLWIRHGAWVRLGFFGVYAMTLILLFSGTQYKMHGTCFWDCPASCFSHAPNVAYFSCSFVQFSWLGTRRSPSLKFLSASYFLAFQLSIPVSFFAFWASVTFSVGCPWRKALEATYRLSGLATGLFLTRLLFTSL